MRRDKGLDAVLKGGRHPRVGGLVSGGHGSEVGVAPNGGGRGPPYYWRVGGGPLVLQPRAAS